MKNKFGRILLFALAIAICALGFGCGPGTEPGKTPPEDTGVAKLTFEQSLREDYINWYGRNSLYSAGNFHLVQSNNSSSGFEVKFYGTSLSMTYFSEIVTKDFMAGDGYAVILADGAADYRSALTPMPSSSRAEPFSVVKNLEKGVHTVKVLKATEAMQISWEIDSISCDGYFLAPPEKPALKMETYGDSITAGRGAQRALGEAENDNTDQQNSLLSYGAVAARELGAQINSFCVSGASLGSYASNVGANIIPKLYSKISPAASANEKWDFAKYVPDVVVIDLGTNDIIGSSGKETDFTDKFTTQYKKFVSALKTKYPNAIFILGCGTFSYSKLDVSSYNEAIRSVAESFADGSVTALELPKSNHAHAVYTEHDGYGKTLAALIREKLAK